jgi:hypothetical protein
MRGREMETLPLYQRVIAKCGSELTAIGATPMDSFVDHGFEVLQFSNSRARLAFWVDAYDEEFVSIVPLNHSGDPFSLEYLLALIAPEQRPERGFSSVQALPSVVERAYALFESEFYKCYRAAYNLFENCRNLIGIKGAGWD